MLLFILLLGTNLDFVSSVDKIFDEDSYFGIPIYHLAFVTDNPGFRVTAINAGDGNTHIFIPYSDSLQIYSGKVTKDFVNYSEDTTSVRHLFQSNVVPLFALYDRNTSGLGDDYLIGVDNNGAHRLARVLSDGSTTEYLCDDCIRENFTGATVTSWDRERSRWVSIVASSTGPRFAVSNNLRDWTVKDWLCNITPSVFDEVMEMFPIADDDDPNKVVWILIRKSKPDSKGLTTLLYSTFIPDDTDQNYQEIGMLDASTEWLDFAIVTDNATDYRHRKVVVAKLGEYRNYSISENTYITGRELSYCNGRLKQMPVSTIYLSSSWKDTIASKSYSPDMSHFESDLISAVSGTIETEFIFSAKGIFGFDLFGHRRLLSFYAASFLVNINNLTVGLYRSTWIGGYYESSNRPDSYTEIVQPFELDESGNVKVLVLFDVCIIEYFVYDGLYAGSILVFPTDQGNTDNQRINSDMAVELRNLKISVYSD